MCARACARRSAVVLGISNRYAFAAALRIRRIAYRIEGQASVYLDRDAGRTVSILGCPTDRIAVTRLIGRLKIYLASFHLP